MKIGVDFWPKHWLKTVSATEARVECGQVNRCWVRECVMIGERVSHWRWMWLGMESGSLCMTQHSWKGILWDCVWMATGRSGFNTVMVNPDLLVAIHTQSHQTPFQECWSVSVIHKLPDSTSDHIHCQFETAYQLVLQSLLTPGLNIN